MPRKTYHCRKCNQVIVFDEEYKSERTGKMIPLDVVEDATGGRNLEPHNCPQYRLEDTTMTMTTTTTTAAPTLYLKCKSCNYDIHFDENLKSDSGKFIPISRLTNKPHQCKENPTAKEYHPEEWRAEREAEEAIVE
jgi:hypothetical protein